MKETVTKKFYIHDAHSRGVALNWQLKHEVLNGNFDFAELDIEFSTKRYFKTDRAE